MANNTIIIVVFSELGVLRRNERRNP